MENSSFLKGYKWKTKIKIKKSFYDPNKHSKKVKWPFNNFFSVGSYYYAISYYQHNMAKVSLSNFEDEILQTIHLKKILQTHEEEIKERIKSKESKQINTRSFSLNSLEEFKGKSERDVIL